MTEPKAVPALLRALNERTVLDAVRADGPISRAEVARKTGISRPTVSLVLRSLLEDGLVRETEHDSGGPHYGALYYEADPDAAVVLGVDFGTRAVRTSLCDLGGEVRAREEFRSSRLRRGADRCAGELRAFAAPHGQGLGRPARERRGRPARGRLPCRRARLRRRPAGARSRPTCGNSSSKPFACR